MYIDPWMAWSSIGTRRYMTARLNAAFNSFGVLARKCSIAMLHLGALLANERPSNSAVRTKLRWQPEPPAPSCPASTCGAKYASSACSEGRFAAFDIRVYSADFDEADFVIGKWFGGGRKVLHRVPSFKTKDWSTFNHYSGVS